MDPQEENPEENPPEAAKTTSKAEPTPLVDAPRTTNPRWAQAIPAAASEDGAEPELPLVTQAFDPLTEPELPLQSESAAAAPGPDATEPTDTTKPTIDTELQPALLDSESADGADAAVETEPKPALPMQKPAPWAHTDPPGDEPAAEKHDGDETEAKPSVPMQKPAPSWAQTVPAPAEPAGEPEPTPPAVPVRSAPLTWPPRAQVDPELPTQSDIWPPEPPTEPAMPAWPPKMIDDAESRLPNLPFAPTPSEWDPPAVSPRSAPASSSPSPTVPTPATVTPAPAVPTAATVPPATVPPAASTPTASPSPTVPPVAPTVPPATVPPAASTPTASLSTAPPRPAPPSAGDPSAPADPAAAEEGNVSHGSALPAVGKKGRWQSQSARPPAKSLTDAQAAIPKEKPVTKEKPAEPAEPPKPAAPAWAPTLVIPQKAKEPATDWPGVVDVPAWAPHLHIDTGPASTAPSAQPPPPPAAKPLAPEPAAPPAGASKPQPAPAASSSSSSGSSSWAVVEQKQVDSQRISREVPSPEDRSYAEWFAWAKRGGAPAGACHAAAQAAFSALASGKDVSVAAQMAAAAMAMPPRAVDAGRQTYCAWFSLGNIDLAFDQRRAHAFATAAVRALDAGGDAKGAHAAGLEAAGIR